MCEEAEVNYLDGDVVWVKLGSCWWPGEVVGPEKLPPDVLPSFRKQPIAVVKFFQEDTYEYVKNKDFIYKYDCSRKEELIKKGLYLYRTKHGPMEKFPEDVIRAESAIGGDPEILTRDEFQEAKKESYAGLFGDPRKRTPGCSKKGTNVRGRSVDSPKLTTPIRKLKDKSNYKVHILVQGSKTPSQVVGTETTLTALSDDPKDCEEEKVQQEKPREETPQEENSQEETTHDETPQEEKLIEEKPLEEKLESPEPTTSQSCATPGIYACHACPFTTTRMNVLILHNKTHSSTFTPYTPSPIKKKTVIKLQKPSTNTPKSPKPRKPRQEKIEKPIKKKTSEKREGDDENLPYVKKIKTDAEIKSSLLADWDDGEEDSNDESTTIPMARSPEVPIAAGSPAVPTPAEQPIAQDPNDIPLPSSQKKEEVVVPDKPEVSNDAKYDFCEDEDWPVEADAGRKIPRVKPSIRKEEKKSLSIDDDDMAREIAELLNKTTVPELPSVPETLKIEENFPEPSAVKSPDKGGNSLDSCKSPEKKTSNSESQPTKTIFKTKTFFRSRHSRSQDAIGKYVAEQLNAAERMNMCDIELNGTEMTLSPEPRITPPPIEQKVARLAPKIQLKKMKAEAAQLREKEKLNKDKPEMCHENTINSDNNTVASDNSNIEPLIDKEDKDSPMVAILSPNKITTMDVTEVVEKNIVDDKIPSDNIILNNKIDKKLEDTTTNVNNGVSDEHDTQNISFSNDIIKKADEIVPEAKVQELYEPYMSESTASAVDALLSVSREADRVTKVISVDPPEDLFEDDKDLNIDNKIEVYQEVQVSVDLKQNVETTTQEDKVSDENLDINSNGDLGKDQHGDIKSPLPPKSPEMTVNDKTMDCEKDHIMELPVESTEVIIDPENNQHAVHIITDNTPSESDLQIAEALINLPSTTISNKTSIEHQQTSLLAPMDEHQSASNEILINSTCDSSLTIPNKGAEVNDKIESVVSSPVLTNNIRFESEEEKSENLNAAQSLVQMSETVEHKISLGDNKVTLKEELKSLMDSDSSNALYLTSTDVNKIKPSESNISSMPIKDLQKDEPVNEQIIKGETTSKLLKILEEPCTSRIKVENNTSVNTPVIVTGKEKIINIGLANSAIKPKPPTPQPTKQKIIIRRTAPNKTLLNNITEVTTPDKIILSRTNKTSEDGSRVQSYTIQTTPDVRQSDSNTILIQQKMRKVKTTPKFQKIKPVVTSALDNKNSKEILKSKEPVFDINSMPVVLSDDILTPESIEKMPLVMSDGNLITSSPSGSKIVKSKKVFVNNEKITVSSTPNKPELKTLLMNATHDINKITTPNILSKSSKLRNAKPMLIIDKNTGKQKIVMPKTDTSMREVKQTSTILQAIPQQNSPKGEKFIILPTTTAATPKVGRTQKIIIDPQTRKAHVIVGKGLDASNSTDSKPVSAKLISPAADSNTPGNTVMIITNAKGGQSRIVLTPEHEKFLFPNKQQPNVSQLKAITHRIATNSITQQKSVVTPVTPAKTQPRGVITKKNAIITSKGQLIVGGRIATTTQNIAPLPEIRPKRTPEVKKIVKSTQKSEPLILLQQKSGAVMQLTAAQFEHLQRTGQIIQKPLPAQENKVVVQKSITLPTTETVVTQQKSRVRRNQFASDSPTPLKKIKHEIAIAPAPSPTPMPSLTPIVTTNILSLNTHVTSTSTRVLSSYPDLENFEELLPANAIVRQTEPVVTEPEVQQALGPAAAPLSDGQLLAVPGEHFGGPQGSFYLCVEENGTYTPIDNRPLVLENNQLVPMAETIQVAAPQPERRDILEAALANSDVFQAESVRDEAPDFRDLNANVSVHCRVSETSTTLNQPIMTPVEMPTKVDLEPVVPTSLDDGLAVIGVTPHTIPTSLELPITVTDPRIAPKTTDPLRSNNYRTSLLPSPNTDLTFLVAGETDIPMVGPISMPLLTDDESVGKSMPILTDELAERTVSSIESTTVESPCSVEVRESETEDGSQWPRRLLTPASDISETSVEIPFQPTLQLSVDEIARSAR